VAYGLNKIPESWLPVYSAINPLGPVIDGLRRTVLYGLPPRADLLMIAAVSSLVWLVGGYWAFKRLEPRFADVA
jgi:ABC-2 type transport system permease protein/lipopolysaccharide transport system permease protein